MVMYNIQVCIYTCFCLPLKLAPQENAGRNRVYRIFAWNAQWSDRDSIT